MKEIKLPDGKTLGPYTETFQVFVYGTLKAGGSLSKGVEKYRIGCVPATALGQLFHNHSYPMLVKSACRTDIVSGEVHTYPIHVLAILDMIEGYSKKHRSRSLFFREKIPVYYVGAGFVEPELMYAYIWKRPIEAHHYLIYSGEWEDGLDLWSSDIKDETGELA